MSRGQILSATLEAPASGPFKLKILDSERIAPTFGLAKALQQPQTLIDQLIAANQDVWELFLANGFCKTGYTSSADKFDAKFKSYSKQDYLYLIEYVRFITYRYLQDPGSRTEAGLKAMVTRIDKDVGYVTDFYNTCVDGMGINKDELLRERVSQAVLGYTAWEQLSAVTDDNFSNYVRMIPCIYGWNKIALVLKGSGQGQEDTLFYKYWYTPNLDDSSAKKLSKYLEDYRSAWESPANQKKWSIAFRQACLFEIAFFDAALRDDLPQF